MPSPIYLSDELGNPWLITISDDGILGSTQVTSVSVTPVTINDLAGLQTWAMSILSTGDILATSTTLDLLAPIQLPVTSSNNVPWAIFITNGELETGIPVIGPDENPFVFIPNDMCRITLKDPNNNYWQITATSEGEIETISIDNTRLKEFVDPVMKVFKGDGYFKLTANTDGTIQSQSTSGRDALTAISYIPFTTQDGIFVKLRIKGDGTFRMFETEDLLPDSIPSPNNVAISNYGTGSKLVHTNCGLGSITARADLGLWCCSCNEFVLPENTNVIVILDE